MACLIDTHVWIWWMGRLQLPASLQRDLDEMPERPFLSVVSLWELSVLVQTGRVELLPSPQEWLRSALHPSALRLAQITREVALVLLELPTAFRRDPADRIIVATARALNVPVLTYDKAIRQSGLVELYGRR
jgi:PIN domain nuclease of toxin-antitoxin system